MGMTCTYVSGGIFEDDDVFCEIKVVIRGLEDCVRQ